MSRNGGIQDPVGSIAGSLHKDGYVYIGIDGRLYLAHRLAVLYVTGEWPEQEVDHKNGVRDDNRWRNLRDASSAQNRRNTLGQHKRNGPCPGVYCVERVSGTRFIAQIKKNKVVHYLGSFLDLEDARAARLKAERRLFGRFAGSTSRGQV
jgi:hypothetical protein